MMSKAALTLTGVLSLVGSARAETSVIFTPALQVSDTSRQSGVECMATNVDIPNPHQVHVIILDGHGAQTAPAASSPAITLAALESKAVDDFVTTGSFESNQDGLRSCMVIVDGAKDTVRVAMCLRDTNGRCQDAVQGQ